jgi:replication-associated recombination protein RarA
MNIASDVQTIVVVVADGDQRRAFTVISEVVELLAFTSLRQDQFGWVVTQKDRRFREAVGDGRALYAG